MRTKYCDCIVAALCARYCDCCAMSLGHQVCPELCTVYYVPGIRSVVYWVLRHWVLGPYALDATSRATAVHCFSTIAPSGTPSGSCGK